MKIEEVKNWYNSEENQLLYTQAITKMRLWASEKFLIEKYVSKDAKILDIGCGAGRTTFALYNLGYKNIVGVDLSDKLIDCAKNYAKENNISVIFLCEDACNLISFKNNSFDFILFSYNGFTNIPQKSLRLKALQEIYRVLKNDGIFIFTAHNRDDEKFKDVWLKEQELWNKNLQDKECEIFGDKFYIMNGQKIFVHFYSVEEIKQEIIDAGFTLIENNLRFSICKPNDNEVNEENTMFYVLKKELKNEI